MRRGILFTLLVFTIIYSIEGPCFSDQKGESPGSLSNPYKIPATTGSIKADGEADEELWNRALMLELKYEVRPGENTPPPVKTEFLIIHNKTHLFAAFRCYDPDPSAIRAHLSDRDNDYGDDFVGVALDTFNDERRNYMLWSNPKGVQEDAIMSMDNGYGISWDGLYKTGTKIYDWGYCVEFSIPFSTLRFPRGNGKQIWGFDAWRNYPRDVQHQIGLFPRDRNNNCYQCQMFKMEGFEGIKPGSNLELAPTVTAVRTDAREELPDSPLEKYNENADAGLTARWGITPNLTLSGTVNPDFSQVEADARQLDINETFALWFHEKRPFFTEGADYFETRIDAIYTRSLSDPSWGIKLTGKEGKNSIGGFLVRDEITSLIFPGSQGSDADIFDMESTATVLRYKRDLGNKYTVGALFANRQGEDYYNRVYGLDGTFRFTKRDRLTLQYLGSNSRYPGQMAEDYGQETGDFGGRAIDIGFLHHTRNVNVFGGYRDISDNFRADLGFVPRVGFKRYFFAGDHRWLAKPGKWWEIVMLGGQYYNWKESDGTSLLRGIESIFILRGRLHSSLTLVFNKDREAYEGMYFDSTRLYASFYCRPTGDILFGISSNFGDKIDYTNIRLGRRVRLSPTLRWSLGNHIRLNLRHTYERMEVNDQHLYTANISQVTAIYQFSTRMFFRSIVQYVNYDYNPDNYIDEIDPLYKNMFVQLLFSYKLNPQTVLFLGYTDNYYGEAAYPLTRSDRTFFLKIGYAWQL